MARKGRQLTCAATCASNTAQGLTTNKNLPSRVWNGAQEARRATRGAPRVRRAPCASCHGSADCWVFDVVAFTGGCKGPCMGFSGRLLDLQPLAGLKMTKGPFARKGVLWYGGDEEISASLHTSETSVRLLC